MGDKSPKDKEKRKKKSTTKNQKNKVIPGAPKA